MSMMLNMQNQCQMYNQYLSFAAFMNNSTPQIRPQPFFGGFPNSYVPPSFGRNPGNFNMMPPFFNNGQFKCKVFQKKLKMVYFSNKTYFQFEAILLLTVENSFWLWKFVPVLYIGFFILSTFFMVFFQFTRPVSPIDEIFFRFLYWPNLAQSSSNSL